MEERTVLMVGHRGAGWRRVSNPTCCVNLAWLGGLRNLFPAIVGRFAYLSNLLTHNQHHCAHNIQTTDRPRPAPLATMARSKEERERRAQEAKERAETTRHGAQRG